MDVTCVFHRDYFAFYDRDWNLKSEINFGITCSKCLMKPLSDFILKIAILEISGQF